MRKNWASMSLYLDGCLKSLSCFLRLFVADLIDEQ